MSMLATLMTFIALGLMRSGSWLAVLAVPAAIYLWIVASKIEWDTRWIRNPILLAGAGMMIYVTLQTIWVTGGKL